MPKGKSQFINNFEIENGAREPTNPLLVPVNEEIIKRFQYIETDLEQENLTCLNRKIKNVIIILKPR